MVSRKGQPCAAPRYQKLTVDYSIIFVHGLRGDAYETWTVDKICWPRDFLKTEPKLKHTRVITWGYDSSVAKLSDFSSQSSIFSHAENLLIDLVRKRQESEEENRPIVFVGHSLGGLVIKEVGCITFSITVDER